MGWGSESNSFEIERRDEDITARWGEDESEKREKNITARWREEITILRPDGQKMNQREKTRHEPVKCRDRRGQDRVGAVGRDVAALAPPSLTFQPRVAKPGAKAVPTP